MRKLLPAHVLTRAGFLCELDLEPSSDPFEIDGVWYRILARERALFDRRRRGPIVFLTVEQVEDE